MGHAGAERLASARRMIRRRHRLPESPAARTMRELAAWMRDPNRKTGDDHRSYPHRLFDFEELARALGPFATYEAPIVHVGADAYRVTTQPGGVDIEHTGGTSPNRGP